MFQRHLRTDYAHHLKCAIRVPRLCGMIWCSLEDKQFKHCVWMPKEWKWFGNIHMFESFETTVRNVKYKDALQPKCAVVHKYSAYIWHFFGKFKMAVPNDVSIGLTLQLCSSGWIWLCCVTECHLSSLVRSMALKPMNYTAVSKQVLFLRFCIDSFCHKVRSICSWSFHWFKEYTIIYIAVHSFVSYYCILYMHPSSFE